MGPEQKSAPAAPRPRRRRLLFGCVVSAATLLALAVSVEVGARLLIPESTFQILSDVYARDPDPRVGYTYRRSFSGRAFGTELVTNSRGYRGPEWTEAKPAGTLRIALLGDSHAFGFGVSYRQTMGELLRERLQKTLGRPVEVLNFAANGYNSRQELAVLQAKALPFAPDLVLVLPCNNDADQPFWVDDEGYLRQDDESSPTAEPNRVLDDRQRSFARFQRKLVSNSRFLLWLRLLWYRYKLAQATAEIEVAKGKGTGAAPPWFAPVGIGPVPEALRAPVYEPLARMAELARAHGAKLALLPFTAFPDWRAMLNALSAEAHVPLLELVPLLDGVSSYDELLRKWSLRWDTHMGPAAQARWAEAVERFLLRERLVQ